MENVGGKSFFPELLLALPSGEYWISLFSYPLMVCYLMQGTAIFVLVALRITTFRLSWRSSNSAEPNLLLLTAYQRELNLIVFLINTRTFLPETLNYIFRIVWIKITTLFKRRVSIIYNLLQVNWLVQTLWYLYKS